jgi:metallo-beta-lactamase family protein
MDIQFLGATQTVTGSKYLIQTGQVRVLVDCVLLMHAHIDHSGYIPLFVTHGFRGEIICTEATRDLCRVLLPDSGHLQEEEARYANLKGSSKHHPAKPLYTQKDGNSPGSSS